MKGQGFEIIKDLFISLLVIVCIAAVLFAIFYNEISLGKVIPQADEYMLTTEMQNELEDTNLDDAEEVVVNYSIDAKDLKKYEKTNEYVKGKSNPFALVDITENVTNDIVDGDNTTSTGGNSNNNESQNFYEDEGIK